MTSEQLYEMGYAIPLYSIGVTRPYRFKGKDYEGPVDLPMKCIDGLLVADIKDVFNGFQN